MGFVVETPPAPTIWPPDNRVRFNTTWRRPVCPSLPEQLRPSYRVGRSDRPALVSIGGDGSLQISYELWKKGLPVVCVPKTIDNDLAETDTTFGHDSAIKPAAEAIDRID